jgi:hypothetical protein
MRQQTGKQANSEHTARAHRYAKLCSPRPDDMVPARGEEYETSSKLFPRRRLRSKTWSEFNMTFPSSFSQGRWVFSQLFPGLFLFFRTAPGPRKGPVTRPPPLPPPPAQHCRRYRPGGACGSGRAVTGHRPPPPLLRQHGVPYVGPPQCRLGPRHQFLFFLHWAFSWSSRSVFFAWRFSRGLVTGSFSLFFFRWVAGSISRFFPSLFLLGPLWSFSFASFCFSGGSFVFFLSDPIKNVVFSIISK